MLTEVTNHNRYDRDITKVDGLIKSSYGNLRQKRTARSWKILVEWKYGLVDCVPLKDLKHSNPVEMDEYTVEN